MKKVQTEKENKYIDLQKRLQVLIDSKKFKYMSEFMNYWNKNNKEKIQDLTKIQDRLIVHLNSITISVNSNLILG